MTTTTTPGVGQLTGNVLFYSKPEPLNSQMHGKLGVNRSDSPFGFARQGHVIPLTVGEFQLAAVSGPIIFVGEEKTPLAVMGLNAGQNMFIQENGMFEPGIYIPAYVRRYPFVFANDSKQGQMILCIDRDAGFVGENPDLPFFDADGKPTEYTQNCLNFCNEYEGERQKTMSFIQILQELDLFEAKESHFTPINPDGTPGEAQKIADYFGVSEEKLRALPAEKLSELAQNGALAQIYAHITSLVNWDKLIAFALARQAAAQPQAANA